MLMLLPAYFIQFVLHKNAVAYRQKTSIGNATRQPVACCLWFYKKVYLKMSRHLLMSLLFTGFGLLANAQQTLTGTVISADDRQPLPGVSITLTGSAKGTATGANGSFSITLSDAEMKEGSLLFSSLNFFKRTVKIGGRSSLSLTLVPTNEELKNVIVTSGYGRAKRKEEVVGAISTVSAAELQSTRPIESFDKMLEGLAAGVQVETNTELGTPVKINIRGQNSLSNLNTSNVTARTTSSQPLFVIDGVPITEQRRGDENIAFLNNEQLLNPIAGINPDDIESISILKDAAATAIYGNNASNGVIIITTKKGRAGKSRFSFGYSAGVSNPINRIKWLNGYQYHELAKELYINEGRSPVTAESLAGSAEINTDWFGLTSRSGNFQNIDAEVSGGNEFNQFRISASYLNQQSIQLGNDYKKFYFRIRIDNKLSNKLSLSTTLAPTITQKNALTVYNDLTPIVPNVPSYNADSSFYRITGVANPLAVLAQNTAYHEGGSLNGNMRLDYAVTKSLKISGNIGTDILLNKLNLYESAKNETGRTKGGFAQIYDRTSFSWVAFTQAAWSPDISKNQKLEVLAGYEMKSEQAKLLRGEGSGFSYYRLNELSNAASQSSASSRQTSNSYSVYSQALYSFKDKYNATLSARSDAASIFGTDINSTINSAIGAGWILSKESWFAKSKAIDMLRLRVSFGTTGNSRIGSYEARGLYGFSSTGYNGQTSSTPQTPPNPNLSWEKSYKTNIGIDFNFQKRFGITADWYQSITDDAISSVTIPSETGFTDVLANTAKLRNRGFDAKLEAQIFKGTFSWNSILNIGYNKNIILKVLNGGQQFSGSSEDASALKAGISTSAIWGYRWGGVDPQTGYELFYDNKGGLRRLDQFPAEERTIKNGYLIGDRLPDYQGGFINSFSYKGLTATVTIVYTFGAEKLINYRNEWNGNNLDNRNQSVNLIDRWQKPGDITTIPKLYRLAVAKVGFITNSSRFVYDASYIKLSNVSLAYTLPKTMADKLKGLRVTVYANGANLLYWYRQQSPTGRNGIREYNYNYPEAQTFTGGIKIGG